MNVSRRHPSTSGPILGELLTLPQRVVLLDEARLTIEDSRSTADRLGLAETLAMLVPVTKP